MQLERLAPNRNLFVVHNVLSPDECRSFIAETQSHGFGDAPVTTAAGFVMMPELRNNTRVIIDSRAQARWLFERLSPFLPETIDHAAVIGLNERFRYYRYEVGQKFDWHRDGAFVRTPRERSRLTLLLYLDDEVEGGATEVQLADGILSVHPRAGMALVFPHPLLHRGAPVTAGRKTVMRTDVMTRL